MEKYMKLVPKGLIIITILFLGGCASSDGRSSYTYYQGYYDPYPSWGRTTIHIDRDHDHDHDHGKPKPPGIKPPDSRPPKPPNMGRPPHRPHKPRPTPRPRPRPRPRRK